MVIITLSKFVEQTKQREHQQNTTLGIFCGLLAEVMEAT